MRYHRGIHDIEAWFFHYVERNKEGISKESNELQENVTISWNAKPGEVAAYPKPLSEASPVMIKALLRLYFMSLIRAIEFKDYDSHPHVLKLCRYYEVECLEPENLFHNRISWFLRDARYEGEAITSGIKLAGFVLETPLDSIWRRVAQDFVSLGIEVPSSVDCSSFWDDFFYLTYPRERRVLISAIQWFWLAPQPQELSTMLDHPAYKYLNDHRIVKRACKIYGTKELTVLGNLPYRPTTPNTAAINCGYMLALFSAYFDLQLKVKIGCVEFDLFDELVLLIHNICMAYSWAGHNIDCYDDDIHYGQQLACTYLRNSTLLYPPRQRFPGWNHRLLVLS